MTSKSFLYETVIGMIRLDGKPVLVTSYYVLTFEEFMPMKLDISSRRTESDVGRDDRGK